MAEPRDHVVLKRRLQARPAQSRKAAVRLDGHDFELLYTGLQCYRVELLRKGTRTEDDVAAAVHCHLLACKLTRANREGG